MLDVKVGPLGEKKTSQKSGLSVLASQFLLLVTEYLIYVMLNYITRMKEY